MWLAHLPVSTRANRAFLIDTTADIEQKHAHRGSGEAGRFRHILTRHATTKASVMGAMIRKRIDSPEETRGPGDFMVCPPGHDASSIRARTSAPFTDASKMVACSNDRIRTCVAVAAAPNVIESTIE